MSSSDRPPNILFLMDDQHRYDVAGFMGDSVARTPHLNRLAQDAVVFDAAYTPSPICIPGRQCLMSGQLPSRNGCRNFGDDLPPFSHTFAAALSEIGYRTACAGKLHHTGKDQMQGWTQRIGMEAEVHPEALGESAKAAADAYQAAGNPMWSLQKELTMAGAGRNPYAIMDDYSVDGACEFIREHFVSPFYDRADHRPLMLKVSLQQPHYPFVCSQERFDYYLNRVQKRADSPTGEHWFAKDWTHHPDVAPHEIQRAVAACYGMVEEVDAGFGRVLAQLETVGENLDDWIIIFTSDHGEMLGEHGTWWKLKFYEGSVRVPLFIRAPSIQSQGHRVDQPVSLCDLYATLCDISGASLPDDRDSRSLLPLMRGDTNVAAEDVISIYATHVMVRRGPWKYWNLLGEPRHEVLFHLEDDPAEVNPLPLETADPALLQSLRAVAEKHFR